jgi:hypothetical protein
VRSATAARLGLGAVCLAAPGLVLDAIGGPDRNDPTTCRIAQVLGARLALQGVGDLVLGQRTRRLDVVVELMHAASMVPAAAVWPRHRRSALGSAAAACCVAVLDVMSTRQNSAVVG